MFASLYGIMGQEVSQRLRVDLELQGRELVGEVVFDMGPKAIVCGYGIYESRGESEPVMFGELTKEKFGRMGGTYRLRLEFYLENK